MKENILNMKGFKKANQKKKCFSFEHQSKDSHSTPKKKQLKTHMSINFKQPLNQKTQLRFGINVAG